MAQRLAADAANRLAAVAPIAGAMAVARFAPSRAMP
jgi:poly(3-hydroxybutyrate) depolymerase